MATNVNSEVEKHPFFSELVSACDAQGVILIIQPTANFGGIECNGYFDHQGKTGPELAIAINGPQEKWEKVMIHEYNHMMQWAEDCDAWKNTFFDEDRQVDCCQLLDYCLQDFIDLKSERLRRVIGGGIEVELDCEKRTVEMIKNLGLDIDVDDYTQKANAYVLFYHWIARTKEFYTIGREPYSIPECYEVFSKKFDENYKRLSYNQQEAFRKL